MIVLGAVSSSCASATASSATASAKDSQQISLKTADGLTETTISPGELVLRRQGARETGVIHLAVNSGKPVVDLATGRDGKVEREIDLEMMPDGVAKIIVLANGTPRAGLAIDADGNGSWMLVGADGKTSIVAGLPEAGQGRVLFSDARGKPALQLIAGGKVGNESVTGILGHDPSGASFLLSVSGNGTPTLDLVDNSNKTRFHAPPAP